MVCQHHFKGKPDVGGCKEKKMKTQSVVPQEDRF